MMAWTDPAAIALALYSIIYLGLGFLTIFLFPLISSTGRFFLNTCVASFMCRSILAFSFLFAFMILFETS